MTRTTTLFVLSALLLTPCAVDAQSIGLKLDGAVPNADGTYQLAAGDDVRFLTYFPANVTQVVLLGAPSGGSGAMMWEQAVVLVQTFPAACPESILDVVVPAGLDGLSLIFVVLGETTDGEIVSSPVLVAGFTG